MSSIRLESYGDRANMNVPVEGCIGNIITGNIAGQMLLYSTTDYIEPAQGIAKFALAKNIITNNVFNSVSINTTEDNIILNNTISKYSNEKNSAIGWNIDRASRLMPALAYAIHSQSNVAWHPKISKIPIVASENLKIEICVNAITSTTGFVPIFGTYSEDKSVIDSMFSLLFCPKKPEGQNTPALELRSYETAVRTTSISEYSGSYDFLYKDMVFVAERNDERMTLTVNGQKIIDAEAPITVNSGNVYISLFARLKQGSVSSSTYVGKCQVKYAKIWSEGELIRDFYPAIGVNGQYALVDTVMGDYLEMLNEI